uniref:Protein sprouty homolog 2-like n=1 Tax=Phallusia mammillata TaxID=59560 RepID=A0A6F9DTN8_9ASCI|nr:protein sprouty homolog 2-like [Phallusia mammillata]
MYRPRTLSAAARTGGGTDNSPTANPATGDTLNLLTNPVSRSRAVENDYSDHPSNAQQPNRPASAPTGVTEATPLNSHTRHHRHLAGERTRRQRSRGEGTRTRRVPGSASRVNPPSATASLPSYLATREVPCIHETMVSNSNIRPHPVIPPRPYPSTVGHLPPRRTSGSVDLSTRPAPPVPSHVCGSVASTPLPSSGAPPPRPPPPGPEVAERLGVGTCNRHTDAVISVRTSQPASRVRSPNVPAVVASQPTGDVEKRRLVVETKDEKLTKSDERKDRSKSTNNSSLKKNPDRDQAIITGDEDHQLMGPGGLDGRSAPKPGDHNYPCPRCGKCTCPRCQGDIPGTTEAARLAASHCWMCNHRCLCDTKACVETATCLCCVRACFYHCSNYEDDDACTDEPCSCRGPHCCLRWSALGALSVFLPCLLCYPVARGCMRACKSCADCVRPGCRCKESYR